MGQLVKTKKHTASLKTEKCLPPVSLKEHVEDS